jgi:hypothetical protein
MPSARPATATPLAAAKDRARRAYRSACEVDAPMAPTFGRWWAETLTQVDGQPADRSATMLVRMAILFEVAADRRGWPERMR